MFLFHFDLDYRFECQGGWNCTSFLPIPIREFTCMKFTLLRQSLLPVKSLRGCPQNRDFYICQGGRIRTDYLCNPDAAGTHMPLTLMV